MEQITILSEKYIVLDVQKDNNRINPTKFEQIRKFENFRMKKNNPCTSTYKPVNIIYK